MLSKLCIEGPTCPGIFRKSANARCVLHRFHTICPKQHFRLVKQIIERLNSGLMVDLSEIPVLATGAIVKEYLRALPDSLFPQKCYQG